MKTLIFGISGQDGYYLSEYLMELGHKIIGVSRSKGPWIQGSVADNELTEALIKDHKPDFIFHFAANSTTNHSALFDNHEAICTGTLVILEAVKKYCKQTKVFLSGSALQFKNKSLPINENSPFNASSSYSVSRIHSTYAARYFRDSFGLKVYVGYFFNHDSPLRSEKHVNQKVAAAVKRIAQGSEEILEIGNVDVKKEFNFAGDTVQSVWTLVSQDAVFEAVLGCGVAHSIQEWTELCFKKVNRNWRDFVTIKEGFVPEYDVLVSDPSLITSLGWKPSVSFEDFADMMLREQSL